MVFGSSSTVSGGSASAAVAMANNAIENARRAAASSRKSRNMDKIRGFNNSSSNLGATKSSGADGSNFDLINNDNAYHVIATLITDRLLPKVQAHSTFYTLTNEDRAFFSKMLPYSVRRKFVDALRYRLQLINSSNRRGKGNSALVNLTKQCQVLGLDKENMNPLLDLSNSAGVRYPVTNGVHQDIPLTSSYENRPYAHANDYMATTQQPSMYGGGGVDNGAPYGMTSSPMAYPNSGYTNPTDLDHTAESLARQQIMAEINETKFLMQGSATPEAKLFWQKHMNELNERLYSLNMADQGQSRGGGNGFESGIYDTMRPQVESYGFIDDQAANNYYEEDQRQVVSPNRSKPTCEVVAPSDLPGGYMFEAQLGSKKFLATVPNGGVTKGQKFLSTMKELDAIEIPVTMGGWNDGLCSCFSAGICHPLLLNGIFLPCIALGQIMTRTGLDWRARPANKLVSSLSCTNLAVFLFFWIAINCSAAFMFMVRWQRGQDLGADIYGPIVALNLLFLFHLQKLVKNTREAIRDKYQIPETQCIGCEDCLCSTFCMSCTICQMGRHTADFDTYNGTCCTRTGLPEQVELASTAIFEDSYRNMVDTV